MFKKTKLFVKFWLHFWNLQKILNIFKASDFPYFRNYWLWETYLLKYLKGTLPEHPSTVNVLTGSKHSWNLHDSTFILLLHHSEINWVGKRLSLSDMASILVIIGRISGNQFRCNYLLNQTFFLKFWLHFRKLHETLNIFKKRWPQELKYFRHYWLPKTCYLNVKKVLF